MAAIQLKGIFLLIWIAIPGLHCEDSTDKMLSKLTEMVGITTEDSTFVDDIQSTSPSTDRGTIQQETNTLPYFTVKGGGCLQQSEAPANYETARLFCEKNNGTIVDLNVFSEHSLTTYLSPKNITMWISFNRTESSDVCMTFYPYENVTCSDAYNYFCYHSQTNDERCRIRQEETTFSDTSTTTLSSPAISGKTDLIPVSDEKTTDRRHLIFLAAGVILFMIVVVGIAGFCIYRRFRKRNSNGGNRKEDEGDGHEVENMLPEVEQTLSSSQMKLQFIDEDTYDHLGVLKKKDDVEDSTKVYGHLIKETNEGDYDTTNFKGPNTEVVDKIYARSNFLTSD